MAIEQRFHAVALRLLWTGFVREDTQTSQYLFLNGDAKVTNKNAQSLVISNSELSCLICYHN